MADYQSDRTGANIDQVLDNADTQLTPTLGNVVYHANGNGVTAAEAATAIKGAKDGQIGLNGVVNFSGDYNTINTSGFSVGVNATNAPGGGTRTPVISGGGGASYDIQIGTDGQQANKHYIRNKSNSAWQPWRELYHDNGNGVTAAEAATAIKGAKDGNIGLNSPPLQLSDIDSVLPMGIHFASSASQKPSFMADGSLLHMSYVNTAFSSQLIMRDKIAFRHKNSGVWGAWQELYHDNGNGVTAAEAATAIKGAKDGGIGVKAPTLLDANQANNSGFFSGGGGSSSNYPGGTGFWGGLTFSRESNTDNVSTLNSGTGALWYRWTNTRSTTNTWSEVELYHTGNTGVLDFGNAAISNTQGVRIGSNIGLLSLSSDIATANSLAFFGNSNGVVGSISTSGTATSYNTSSDNRLKTVIGKPSDADIDAKFNDIYETFTLFNWKNNPDGEAVWGFLAHDVIDKGLDFGSEGEGPRNLNIGDVYETIPAETEERPILDEDGNETGEFETVVIKEAIEKRVTPAGVDQSKIAPYLVAKIEQLERRLAALEGA